MIGCMFGNHNYVFVTGSLKKTGEAVNWIARIVPEYTGTLKCSVCGKEKTEKYIIYGE